MGKQFKKRASHIDGGVETDESLNPIGNDKIGELMCQDKKIMAGIMGQVMSNKADSSALDL